MKKIMLFLGVLGSALLFTACSSIHSSDGGSMSIHPQTVGPVDDYRPLYNVNDQIRVSGSADVNVLFGLFAWGDVNNFADNASVFRTDGIFGCLLSLLPNAKDIAAKAAFYNACKNGKCDAVVASRYEISEVNYFVFKKMNAKVTGFPAVLSSVETVKPMPFYVDAAGKIVVLDKFIKPYCLINLYQTPKKSWLF